MEHKQQKYIKEKNMNFVFNPTVGIEKTWWLPRLFGFKYIVYLSFSYEIERKKVLHASDELRYYSYTCKTLKEACDVGKMLAKKINGHVIWKFPDEKIRKERRRGKRPPLPRNK